MLHRIGERIIAGENITADEALALTRLEGAGVLELISVSNSVTRHYRGDRLELCAIINARSGNCSEDCAFCAQSSCYRTGSPVYPMVSPGEALRQAVMMERAGAEKFSLVTSGRGISDRDLEKALAIFEVIKKETGLALCASLGIIDEQKAVMLKQAGVSTYHHNLETAASFFPAVCTTHSYGDRVNTIRAAQKAGLRVCAGGIWGLGETFAQRVEMAFEIKNMGIDSVPVNFLNPIKGTPLEKNSPLSPLTLLHSLAITRLILPRAVIRLCGGRSTGLGRLQPLAFMAGADGVMIGDYLTTKGEELNSDRQMFADLGLKF